MNKSRRFPGKFFKSLRDDPILDDAVGVMGRDGAPASDEDRYSSLATLFAGPFGDGSGSEFNLPDSGGTALLDAAGTRDYVINSIFAPPELREEGDATRQQLVFVKEHEGTLVGLQEVNALIRKGWRVVNAFATGNSAFYKALVLMER